MIKIIISGEGNSDIGEIDHETGQFVLGPITILTGKILHWHHKYDFDFQFRTRLELKRYPMTLKGKKKREKMVATGKGHSDLAYKLACIAKENSCHLAILMRDADRRDFDIVYQEIKSGFLAAKFDYGIPAVPVPNSEAWLICCIIPERSQHIESESNDLKKLLEQILLSQHQTHDKETLYEIANLCDIESIQSHSFQQYKIDIRDAVQYLS